MLLKVDASALEWRTKVFLAQDRTAIKEINEGLDLHADNQRTLGLPTRTIAKIFLYRAIFADAFGERGFAGPAFAYANDSDFMGTSTSAKFWETVIERLFTKYEGVYTHSVGLIRTAIETGKIVSPTGRFYDYSPIPNRKGTKDWPRTQILNHIVQGLAADFVMLARLMAGKRIPALGYGKNVLLINTVHDDLELDVVNDPEICYNVSCELEKCFQDIPIVFEKHYGVNVNVPLAGEVKFGMTLFEDDMVRFNKTTFEKDWTKLCNSL